MRLISWGSIVIAGTRAAAAWAEPAPPVFHAPITGLAFGVICKSGDGERVDAPQTDQGYITRSDLLS